jgi:hypothetical protein
MGRWLLTGCVVLVCAGCLGGGATRPRIDAAPPATSPQEARLQGQWELVTVEAQGTPRQATGRLTFDAYNNIAVRAELAPGEAGVAAPRTVLLDFSAKAVVSADELSYVGLERRAPADQMVPTAAEPSAWRHYSLDGDTLRVSQVDGSGRPIGTLVFRRVR